MRKLKKKCHQFYLLSREFFCYIIYLARDKRQISQNGHDYNFVGVVRSPLWIRIILLLATWREFRCDGLLHTIFSNSVQLYMYVQLTFSRPESVPAIPYKSTNCSQKYPRTVQDSDLKELQNFVKKNSNVLVTWLCDRTSVPRAEEFHEHRQDWCGCWNKKSKLVSKILQVVGLERNRVLSIQGCLVVTGRMKYEGDLGQSRLFSRPYSLLTHKWSQDVRSNCMASYARKRLQSSIRMTFGFRFTQFPYFNWGF